MKKICLLLAVCLLLYPKTVHAASFYGVLSAPDVNLYVNVYKPEDQFNSAELQQIVDAPESAVMMTPYLYGARVVADHRNQGFNKIKKLTPGQYVYLYTINGIEQYLVVFVDFNGINDGDIKYYNGISVFAGGNDNLVLYTCNKTWHSVTIVQCVRENL